MDQSEVPLVEALALRQKHKIVGFGAPGHHQGAAVPRGLKRMLGAKAFAGDMLTPKGLDDRTEGLLAVQRAHEIAAEAWGADQCRFVTGGSTQSLHVAMAAVLKPGDTVLIAQNAHKAEWAGAIYAGYRIGVVPVAIEEEWDLEHGVAPDTLEAAFAAHPDARAAIVVSPTYYGVTSDIAALAAVCHARGVPLIVDAAWGGAFAFSSRLPADPLSQGADLSVASIHKTMGGLAQGSVLLAKGGFVDLQRLALAYELFETTSPATPIMATLDATRRDHALEGEKRWGDLLDLAAHARERFAAIPGVRLWGREQLGRPGAVDLDESKVLLDIARWGVSGYAVDDWLYGEKQLSVALSDARHLLLVIGLGTTKKEIDRLADALDELYQQLKKDPATLPAAPAMIPRIGALGFETAMPAPQAFFADVELVRFEDAAGRIAAEVIAPAPPGIPRLIPGQRISEAHVAWLVANRDAGMFILDPADPTEACVRVVRQE